jgi:hypothetical protein
MKNNDNAGELSLAEFNKLLREAAIREGKCIPENEDELRILEEHLNGKKIEVPEFKDAMRLARSKKRADETNSVALEVDEQVLTEFALAARNGGEISKETRKKMMADRRREQGKK